MSKPDDQRIILEQLRRHVEEGRLGANDLAERLLPAEMALLREGSDAPAKWPEASHDRLTSLLELGNSRRALGREPLALLVVGFSGEGRERLTGLLARSPDLEFQVSFADTPEQAHERIERGALDAALLDLRDAGSPGARLARAEVMRSDLPLVSVVSRDLEAPVGALGVIYDNELDAESLSHTIFEAVARHRIARALDAELEKEHVAAARDALTGLPNRVSFSEQLERALHYAGRNSQQVAVLLLVVDAFQGFAEELAEEVRESLILAVAERLQGALRRSELIARVGDGEFLVMLQGRELEYAPARTAERLLESLGGALVVDGEERELGGAIGIATYPRDAAQPDALVSAAEAALRQIMSEGGRGYRFHGLSLSDVDARRHRIAQRLRGAIERNDLCVHYQPCVESGSGAIVGAEALLRWNDSELGSVSPAEFVPIAERLGLMCDFGAFVMREACRAHARWTEAGCRGLRVAVNVSAHQIESASLRDAVVEGVMGAGLAPGSLEIELTETALVDNPGAAAPLMRELAEIGVSLALDDFGTGFSALSHLRTFPVRTLKIDPSFVHEIRDGAPFPPFVHAILSLADAIGLGVVAEGVETEVQRDQLLERGCRQMQGFLFSRPVPEDELLELLRSGRTLPAD